MPRTKRLWVTLASALIVTTVFVAALGAMAVELIEWAHKEGVEVSEALVVSSCFCRRG